MVKLARVQAEDDAGEVARAEERLETAMELTADQGAEAVRATEAQLTGTAREAARSGLAAVRMTAARQEEVARALLGPVPHLMPAFVQVVGEQVRENLRIATAIGGATDWNEVARIQLRFVHDSLARMGQLGAAFQQAVSATASTSRR